MMNVDEYKLPLKKVIEEFELEKIYETDDLDSVMITNTDVNRPGLQMVGFFDYFDNNRIQIMGKVEFTYLEQLHADERAEKIEKLMSQHIPALIVTRGLQIFPEMIELAEKYNVPLLRSESGTSAFMSALIAYLNGHAFTAFGISSENSGASAARTSLSRFRKSFSTGVIFGEIPYRKPVRFRSTDSTLFSIHPTKLR